MAYPIYNTDINARVFTYQIAVLNVEGRNKTTTVVTIALVRTKEICPSRQRKLRAKKSRKTNIMQRDSNTTDAW